MIIKSIGKLTLAAILAGLVVGMPAQISAQTNAATTAPAAAKSKTTQFKGKVTAVDKTAKTVTVDNKAKKDRVFSITSETKILKGKTAATLDEVTVGDEVSGSFTEADGKMTAKMLRVAVPAAAPAK